MSNKVLIRIILAIPALIIAILIISYYGPFLWASWHYNVINSYISPDNRYVITIKANEPIFLGGANVKINSRMNTIFGYFEQMEYQTEINNDGKNLDKDDVVVTWKDNNATVELNGIEGTIKINFTDKTIRKETS